MSIHLPRLQEIIEEMTGPNGPQASPNASMMDLGLDSLDREELVMVVEEQFNIRLSTTDMGRLSTEKTTVQDWLDYLDKHI